MRAYEITEFGIDGLKINDQEVPEPRFGEVLVKFSAFSVNFRDLMTVRGDYNKRMRLPVTPFSDGAGEVAAVGEGVERWVVGDRVMPIFMQGWAEGAIDAEKSKTALGGGQRWQGVLREYGTFSQDGLVSIPSHLSFEEAATLPCAAVTAWHALFDAGRLQAGETVLTLGTGGVSTFATQFAVMAGAKVIATSSSDEKLEKVRSLGAAETINYRNIPEWDSAVATLTGGVGVDHVVEVGGPGTIGRSLKAVKTGGHVAVIGVLDTGESDFSPMPILMRSLRLTGIYVGSRKMFEDMNAAISHAKLRPVVDSIFDFEDARDALRYMEKASHFGKIVIKI